MEAFGVGALDKRAEDGYWLYSFTDNSETRLNLSFGQFEGEFSGHYRQMKTELTAEQINRIKEIVLDKWVDANDDVSQARLAQLLARVESPVELHQIAANLSWDTGPGVLEKVITHPWCEKGTALMIYFMGRPEWYYRHLQGGKPLMGDQPQSFAFLQKIEQSVRNQEFRTGLIRFDPRKFRGNLDSLSREGAELVPSFMKRLVIDGEDIEVMDI